MKVVLMLCETFPPESDVGGLRGASFCKYLPKYGWKPVIFSRFRPPDDPESNPIMKIPGMPDREQHLSFKYGKQDERKVLAKHSLLNKINNLFFPDYAYPPGIVEKWLKESEIQLKNVHFDCVWGTSPSLGCLSVAKQIADAHQVPWIADFRDITEQDRFKTLRDKLFASRMILRRGRIVRSAAAIVTVSKHHAQILKKKINKEVYVIYNGFDPDVHFSTLEGYSQKFLIVYSGNIFNSWLRNPDAFWGGIDLLLGSLADFSKDVKIQFYGSDAELVRQMSRAYNCSSLIECSKPIPYLSMAKVLRESSVLLLLTNRGRNGILTTKFFEYLAVKKPILCVPGDGGELDSLLNQTGAGEICPTAEDVASMLSKWYLEWKRTGSTHVASNAVEIDKFSRIEESGQLAALLDNSVQSSTL